MGSSSSRSDAAAAAASSSSSSSEPASSAPRTPVPRPRLIMREGSEKFRETCSGSRTGNVVVFRQNKESALLVECNQRMTSLHFIDNERCYCQVSDSVIVAELGANFINCNNCEIVIEDANIPALNFFNCHNNNIYLIESPCMLDTFHLSWLEGSDNNTVHLAQIGSFSLGKISPKVTKSFPPITPAAGSPAHETVLPDGSTVTTQPIPAGAPALSATSSAVLAMIEKAAGETFSPDANEYQEFDDDEAKIDAAVAQTADLIRAAKHVVVYSGAGISTSAGIGDFRGPKGAWTLRDMGVRDLGSIKELDDLTPTLAHVAITALHAAGLVHYVTSTNFDCLHIRSGLPPSAISELHGNCRLEYCKKCDKQYFRSFDVLKTRTENFRLHLTGRKCEEPGCDGDLLDTMVHFCENMPDRPTLPAIANARKADLALVMGTSGLVQPVASFPPKALNNPGGALVVVNKQETPFDKSAAVVCHCSTDVFAQKLCAALGVKLD